MTAETFAADLADDALVLLVGPSGSGKSTWAARHFGPEQVLSSDACRHLVAGDAADQSATADAFKVLHVIARARLRRGLFTVVDATNLTQRARRGLLRLASRAERPVVAIAFDFSLEAKPDGGRANMGHTGGTADSTPSLADASGDGTVDGIDVLRIAVAFGSSFGDPRWDGNADLDSNNLVDGNDLAYVAGDFGQICP